MTEYQAEHAAAQPDLPHVPVRIENWHEMPAPQHAQAPLAGYVRSTWTTHNAPLAGPGVQPVQLLKSDTRRGRATIISIDQDIYIAATEAELMQGPSQAAPQGGYWPKQVALVVTDSDPLYALAVATGASKVTVHAESTIT